MRAILFCIFLTLSPVVFAADNSAQVGTIIEIIKSADIRTTNDRALIEAAIDAGPNAVAQITPYLKGNKNQQSAALVALAYIGGDTALTTLRRFYDRTHSTEAKAILCFALASRGSSDDRAFLIKSLVGEQFGDEWPPIVSAAFSLGLLRTHEALGALKATAAKEKGSIASDAASEAIRWIEHGRWEVELPPSASLPDKAIAAALSNGVPRSNESTAFFDKRRGRIWSQKNGDWSYRQGAPERDLPSITFDVHFNPQSTRAIVSVGLMFGPLNGVGYDYLLRSDGNTWDVEGIVFTWIS